MWHFIGKYLNFHSKIMRLFEWLSTTVAKAFLGGWCYGMLYMSQYFICDSKYEKKYTTFLSSHRLYCICCIFLAFECLRECFSLGKCNTANPSLKSERSELSLLEFIRQNRFKSTPNQKSKAQRMYEMVILDTGFGEFEFSRTFWRFWNFPHFLTFEEFQPEFFGPFWHFGNLNFSALFYI